MRFGSSSIRQEFDSRLTDLAIDCFTLYVQDAWHPNFYFPHDVDPWHFYPEPLFTGPPVGSLDRYFTDLKSHPSLTIYSAKLRTHVSLKWSTSTVTASYANPLAAVIKVPCFDTYESREQLVSRAIISTAEAIHPDAERPDILFLNSRSADLRSADVMKLLSLGRDILEFARLQSLKRRGQPSMWADAMQRALRCAAQLMDIANRDLRLCLADPTSLYKNLLNVLVHSCGIPLSELHASLHLFEPSAKELQLIPVAAYPEDNSPKRYSWSARSAEKDLSICLCTALRGIVHVLRNVDQPRSPSVFLTSSGECDSTQLPACLEIKTRSATQIGPTRMVWHRNEEGTEPSWESLVEKKVLSQRLATKLEQRGKWHYGQIFKEHGTWGYGGSEVCVPILLSGQTIGCVNFESQRPDVIDYPFLNMLLALSTIAGNVIGSIRNNELLNVVEKTVAGISRSRSPADVRSDLDGFARVVRNQILCDSVDFVRTIPSRIGCTAVRIASSDVGVADKHPRLTGWSCKLVQDSSAKGIVLETNNGEVQRAYRLNCDATSDPIYDGPTTISDRWGKDYRLLVGLSLEPSTEKESMEPLGVVWFAYNHPGRAYFRDQSGDEPPCFRLSSWLPVMTEVAKRCVPVPLAWVAEQRSRANVSSLVRHGPALTVLRAIGDEVDEAREENRSLDVEKLLHLKTLLDRHWFLLKLMGTIEVEDQLVDVVRPKPLLRGAGAGAPYGSAQSNADDDGCVELNLENAVIVAWKSACAYARQWPAPSLHPKGCDVYVRTYDQFLFLVLYNIFENAINYGGGVASVSWDKDKRTLTVADSRGDLQRVLAHWDLPSKPSDAVTSGLAVIRHLGDALGDGHKIRPMRRDLGVAWKINL